MMGIVADFFHITDKNSGYGENNWLKGDYNIVLSSNKWYIYK